MMVSKTFGENFTGKFILKEALEKIIPDSILNSKKQGFSSPDASWFKGESINFVKERLHSKNSLIYNFLNFETVNDILETHFKGKENKRLIIWSLLSFDQWLKENF